jgi:outer membrane lipoprotein-sorting protein
MRTQTAAAAHPKLVLFRLATAAFPVVILAFPMVTMFAPALPLVAQTPALDDAFARMDKTAQQFKTVVADMKRDVHTAVINDDAIDMGTIRVKREKSRDTRMLIELTSPDAKSVSLDGAFVSVYLPKSKVVQVYEVGAKRGLVDEFLLLGFGASSAELKEKYDVTLIGTEKLGSDDTWHLQLIPKSKEALQHLKKAELWIGKTNGLPAQQRLVTSSTGDFMLITYSNVKFNPPLPDGALKLSYPKGVTVEHPRL